MSKRWMAAARRRGEREDAARLHATRLDAAVALVVRHLVDLGIKDGDDFLDIDVEDISWDVEDGEVFVRVPFRIGKLTRPEVEREFARRK